MIKQVAEFIRPILDFPYVRQTRRNHALEHATIHLLSRFGHGLSGRSDANGFIIMGDVPTERLEKAVQDALGRLKKGDHKLALHPNCGTNLVTTGFLTTTVALLGFTGANRKNIWDRFPLVMLMTMGAVLFSQPLGIKLQEHITTEALVGDMQIVQVERKSMTMPFKSNALMVHRVTTRDA